MLRSVYGLRTFGRAPWACRGLRALAFGRPDADSESEITPRDGVFAKLAVDSFRSGLYYRDSHNRLRCEWTRPLAATRCLIVKKRRNEGTLNLAQAIIRYLKDNYGIQSFVEKSATAEFPGVPSLQALGKSGWTEEIDFVIVLGGDGTLLHAQTIFQSRIPPVIGFSCGSLGFLLPFEPQDYKLVIDRALAGELEVLQRKRLQFSVSFADQDLPASRPVHLLNEVAIKRAHEFTGGLQEIVCHVDGVFLAKYQGDGVLVASPTGSTAYSMATGGSIVHPQIDCILLTPLCSMTLSSRPIILPGSSIISLTPTRTTAFLEGRLGQLLPPESTVNVSRSPFPLNMFARESPTKDWVLDLGSKLLFERQVRVEKNFMYGGANPELDPQSVVLVRSPSDSDASPTLIGVAGASERAPGPAKDAKQHSDQELHDHHVVNNKPD